MGEENILLVDRSDNGVVTLTLNRPTRKNALSSELVVELNDAIRDITRDADVRCVILKGAGGCFCSGGDLGPAMSGQKVSVIDQQQNMSEYGNMINAIVRCPKPFIAEVEGYAIGGGLSLALACDLIYAGKSAQMSSNFTHVGVSPEMGSLEFLSQSIGMYRAKELWYSARRVSADEAYDMGFVSRVIDDDKLDAETKAMADHIATLPRVALTTMKRCLNSHEYSNLDSILALDPSNTPLCLSDEESLQYLMANFNKKK